MRKILLIISLLYVGLVSCNNDGGGDKPPPLPIPVDTIHKPVDTVINGDTLRKPNNPIDTTRYDSKPVSVMAGRYTANAVTSLVPDGATDNWQIITDLINASHKETFTIPNGNFFMSKALELNRGITLIGSGNTNFIFPKGESGLHITGFDEVWVEKINIRSNAYWLDPPIQYCEGIWVNTIVHLKDVTVRNFAGYGIYILGGITSTGGNTSKSTFTNVAAIENASHGFFMDGGDANAMSFFSCDARDNNGHGFYDDSFLGNYFFGCMGHNNTKGHFVAGDPNNRAVFSGCYGEGGSGKSYVGGAARVYGGIHPDGWTVHDWAKVDYQ